MYHATDGLFFDRLFNGDVHIVKTQGKLPDEAPDEIISDTIVQASVWASACASVSHRGEDYASWLTALVFHDGKTQ